MSATPARRDNLLPRSQRPSWRVNRAMRRISRDRWISGLEVRRIGYALASCSSGSPASVVKYSYAAECEVVGMIRGMPPAFVFEPHYPLVLDAVRKNEKRGSAFIELALLRTVIQMKGLYANNR